MVKGQTILSTLKLAAIGAVLILQWVVLMAPALATETIISPLKITEIYPDADTGLEAIPEFIELANMSASPIPLDNYQLQIKGNTKKKMRLAGELPAYSHGGFATTFTLVNTGDVVQLVWVDDIEAEEVLIEEVTYTETKSKAKSWSYFLEGWELAPPTMSLPNQREAEEPEEPESEPEAIPSEACHVVITEISAQANLAGKEYIEFFNPANIDMSLQRCTAQINGKPAKVLPTATIAPQRYYVWELSSGNINNSGGTITLQQSDGTALAYQYLSTAAGQVMNYDIHQTAGMVSGIPTPGAMNELDPINEEAGGMGAGATASLADCGPGRYRNPETNRCRNIEATTATLVACAADQERNPETNRCRKIATASSTLTPCKAGQERNPETNRCRQIATATSTLKPCAEGQERNPATNRCRKVANTSNLGASLSASQEATSQSAAKYTPYIIASIAVACIGYGIYEYRFELQHMRQKIKWLPQRSRPPD